MGGALLELIATGKQDSHLTGNPQITFFKSVHKRHTNFSVESISQQFLEAADFGKKVSCIIDRKGDLLSQTILEVELPGLETSLADADRKVSWINGIGHHMIKTIELTIGGEVICSMTGEFLDIYSELTVSGSQRDGYYKMVGKYTSYDRTTQRDSLRLYIPIPFWFCRDMGLVLPLIAMQYSEIRINVEFRPFSECWFSGTTDKPSDPSPLSITSAAIYCDYIYLDTFERKKFATMQNLEYLIEQVQLSDSNTISANSSSSIIDFYFNHPVKELIWVYQPTDVSLSNDWGNFSNTLADDTVIQTRAAPLDKCQIKLNGQDRFESRGSEYFRLVQPYQRHTTSPDDYVYMYSFGINPEKAQPSGSCNFSKIDSSLLLVDYKSGILAGQIRIYAINYNILKIKNGMAGLMYS